MHRFFVPPDWLAQDRVFIKGEQAHQICHVLRLKSGSHITVLDNSGLEYNVEIEKVGGELVQGKVVSRTPGTSEPKIRITLYQALLKTDKFELVLQKSVELGVSAIVPFTCERCVVSKSGEAKTERWGKIVQEAAEQSGRAVLPALHSVISFKEACNIAKGFSLLFWEEEKVVGLSQVIGRSSFREVQAVNIFIGPEGGFSSSEVEYARAQGIAVVSLGRRILRAETAAIAATSAVLYEKGELG